MEVGGGDKPGKDSMDIVSKIVAEKVICMWRKRENFSDIGKKCSAQSREVLYSKFQDINKIMKRSRSTNTSRAMKSKEFSRTLSHAALCKCKILSKRRCLVRRRVPALGALDHQEIAERHITASCRLAPARNEGQAP